MSTTPHDYQAASATVFVPPLAPGDRMTRDEFERRWEAMPELKCAELIEGVVHMAAAVRYEQHGNPHANLLGWLFYYAAQTPGVEVADNTSVRLDLDNEPQPDAIMRVADNLGGQSRIGKDGILEGAPELVVEISASSTSFDLHDKLHVYRKHGVREYVVWRVLDREIDWFVLREGRFDTTEPFDAVYHSTVFPGLWLDAPALIDGNSKQVLDILQLGLATEEHAQFLNELRQRDKES